MRLVKWTQRFRFECDNCDFEKRKAGLLESKKLFEKHGLAKGWDEVVAKNEWMQKYLT